LRIEQVTVAGCRSGIAHAGQFFEIVAGRIVETRGRLPRSNGRYGARQVDQRIRAQRARAVASRTSGY
jgi:hypothetical protein